MRLTASPRLLAIAIFAMGASMAAAQGTTAAPAKPAANTAKDAVKSKPSVLDQLGAKRDALISEHEALQKQLKDATEAQKKAILEKMEEKKRAFEETARALQKQYQDERRKQRQGAAAKP
jgi:hypothetical protein